MTIDTDKFKCYDKPGTADRYTIVGESEKNQRGATYWPYIGASADPTHPLGVSYYGELSQRPGAYLGKRIKFSELPEAVQGFAACRLSDD